MKSIVKDKAVQMNNMQTSIMLRRSPTRVGRHSCESSGIEARPKRQKTKRTGPKATAQRLAFPYMYDIHCVWHFAPRQHGDFQTRLLTEGCISWKLLKCMHFVFLETNLRTFLEILQNSIFRISVPEMFPHFSVATHPYQMRYPLKCQNKKTQLIRFYRFTR